MLLAERFWSKVDKVNGSTPVHVSGMYGRCWPFLGFIHKDGRGQFKMNGRYEAAHRVAFFLAYGHWPTPQGLHRCDFPACCNPAHIFEGTQQDNIQDMMSKGRQAGVKGNTHSRKLTDEDVLFIRKRLSEGFSQRQIAVTYRVSQATVSNISTNTCWGGLQ